MKLYDFFFRWEGKDSVGWPASGEGPEVCHDCEDEARRKYIELLNESGIFPRKIYLVWQREVHDKE
jgi:hypothetical protein